MACEDCEDASFTHFYAWCFREKKTKKTMAGPNHRNFQRYVGLPCLVDADCFTKCRKPALASLQEGLFFFSRKAWLFHHEDFCRGIYLQE